MKNINIQRYLQNKTANVNKWVISHYLQVAVFNLFLIMMFLLHTAGYFDPFFLLSINAIVFISLFVSIFLFGAGSRAMFTIALAFWIFAGIIKVLGIDVWAERTAIYAFQSMFLGVMILVFENDG